MQKIGWFGVVRGTQDYRQCHHSIERYDFLFNFNKSYVAILYDFRYIYESFLSKVADFNIPNLHFANFAKVFGIKNLEYLDYRAVLLVCRVYMFNRFSRTPICNRQTQTHGHSIYSASIASRGKN